MKYLKVWTDLRDHLKPFGDAEKGRLFDAMMEYAECGIAPELHGNERYIWETVRAEIDRQRAAYERQCAVNKDNITKRYETLRTATNGYEPKQEHKTKDYKTKDKEKEKRKVFAPPTVDAVSEYCLERNNGIDPQAFVDFYTANGWVQGKGQKPIRDWKACVRTWEQKRKQEPATDHFAAAKSFFGVDKGDYIDV